MTLSTVYVPAGSGLPEFLAVASSTSELPGSLKILNELFKPIRLVMFCRLKLPEFDTVVLAPSSVANRVLSLLLD